MVEKGYERFLLTANKTSSVCFSSLLSTWECLVVILNTRLIYFLVIIKRLNLIILLRYTVGKITPIGRREVRASDYGPKASFWMNFPKKGSRLTPSHRSVDFKWKDYCPMVFRFLAFVLHFPFINSILLISICSSVEYYSVAISLNLILQCYWLLMNSEFIYCLWVHTILSFFVLVASETPLQYCFPFQDITRLISCLLLLQKFEGDVQDWYSWLYDLHLWKWCS